LASNFETMFEGDYVSSLKKLNANDINNAVCDITDLTLIQYAYANQLKEALNYLRQRPESLLAVNTEGVNFLEFVFIQEGVVGVKAYLGPQVDVFTEDGLGQRLFDVFLKDDQYNLLVKHYLPMCNVNKFNPEGLDMVMVAGLNLAINNVKACLDRFPERAEQVLNLSIIQGEVRACVESFVVAERLKTKALIQNELLKITFTQNSL
jgi:hypothetical protein